MPSENVELAGRIAQAVAPGDFVTLLEDEEQRAELEGWFDGGDDRAMKVAGVAE